MHRNPAFASSRVAVWATGYPGAAGADHPPAAQPLAVQRGNAWLS